MIPAVSFVVVGGGCETRSWVAKVELTKVSEAGPDLWLLLPQLPKY